MSTYRPSGCSTVAEGVGIEAERDMMAGIEKSVVVGMKKTEKTGRGPAPVLIACSVDPGLRLPSGAAD